LPFEIADLFLRVRDTLLRFGQVALAFGQLATKSILLSLQPFLAYALGCRFVRDTPHNVRRSDQFVQRPELSP
jgi:hypothetical protein